MPRGVNLLLDEGGAEHLLRGQAVMRAAESTQKPQITHGYAQGFGLCLEIHCGLWHWIDAALNFLWDETVATLRSRVAGFDLEYFFNSVVTDQDRRQKLESAEDLKKLDDWELIRGCHQTGMLSDIGFQHLDYIRNMRNWASAAHPNQNELSGLQVISWLETCIREVFVREPEGPVLEVRRLLSNVRAHALGADDIGPVVANIRLLAEDLAKSLLRTIFGMYVDPRVDAQAKNNIKLFAQAVWEQVGQESKHEIGLRHARYASNADIARRDAAREFLDLVDGLAYLPQSSLTLEMDENIQSLFNAHLGMNNFYNEPPHARNLTRLVPKTGDIPAQLRRSYVKTLIMCRIGNGYGISYAAVPMYDELIGRFLEPEIDVVASLIGDSEVASRLQFLDCGKRFSEICSVLKNRTTNLLTRDILEEILRATPNQLPKIGGSSKMQELLKKLNPPNTSG